VVVLIFWFIMRFTPFGRLVLAVGSNEAAVRLAGINVWKYKLIVYITSGCLAALAGVFAAGRTALGAPSFSTGDYALTTVAACVIGGVALEGGKGTVIFTMVGVFILALITNIMNLLGVASYPQLVIKGAIIVLAIFLSKLGQKSSI
jgi:ribose transport system permease protein